MKVPVASDGSTFDKDLCRRNGVYTVGEKGNEQRFGDFEEVLAYLRDMGLPKWRRPNSKGRWGIVQAVDWGSSKLDERGEIG
ncbi:hypothetical protein CEK62_09265 [Alcanivorax sp. N3-2A]|nr:hypothetical protein CEK62_09265 [Alcanivorax sp. N3-2A]